jgi:STE24 endopeptidase
VTFAAPVVFEPLFNRFRPFPDREVADELRALAARGGVPVREVLVSDASRRTRKQNAYVSGIGRTRRVVVFDTLAGGGDTAVLHGVVAHELGHRRYRHVAVGTTLAMTGAVVTVLVLWALLSSGGVLSSIGAASAGSARVIPFVLLVAAALELLALPVWTAVSRRWERSADRFALELTRDPDALETTFRRLALSNLSDLDPPRALYLATFTHPTPPERIAMGRAWATEHGTTVPPMVQR